MSNKTQTFKNHARFAPLFHGFVLPVLFINLIWSGYRLYRVPSYDAGERLLLAAALMALSFSARVFALAVQDRVIRLEMRLKLQQLLPGDLQARIPELTVGQLVALRFASDAELPALTASVIRDNIRDKTTIKKMINQWQGDHQRA